MLAVFSARQRFFLAEYTSVWMLNNASNGISKACNFPVQEKAQNLHQEYASRDSAKSQEANSKRRRERVVNVAVDFVESGASRE